MHKTSPKVFEQLLITRPACERAALFNDHQCQGRSTFEHAIKYAGKQIPDAWAVIRICEYAHSLGNFVMTGILDKEINEWIALRHASHNDLRNYPRVDWGQRMNYLSKKYSQV